MNMWAARADDGYVLGGLTKQCVDTLRGVPMLVESNDSRVRERLLPDTYDGAEDEAAAKPKKKAAKKKSKA